MIAYVQAFSPAVRHIFEHFEFHTQIDRLHKAGLLNLVTEKFANIDLHPKAVSNAQMGAVFEELIPLRGRSAAPELRLHAVKSALQRRAKSS